jgi:tetratricopeptide (TPR) repeat protein
MKRLINLLVAVVAEPPLRPKTRPKKYLDMSYQSAKEQFEKLVAANPNDLLATYWLGQSMIELKDTAGAKALYQKALMSNGNAPALLVGMGHIELLEGKKAEARQRFELALNLTKGKDIPVMNGIGYAIIKSKEGDANFVIEKLLPSPHKRF